MFDFFFCQLPQWIHGSTEMVVCPSGCDVLTRLSRPSPEWRTRASSTPCFSSPSRRNKVRSAPAPPYLSAAPRSPVWWCRGRRSSSAVLLFPCLIVLTPDTSPAESNQSFAWRRSPSICSAFEDSLITGPKCIPIPTTLHLQYRL